MSLLLQLETHVNEKQTLVIDFSRCAENFKRFDITLGKEKSNPSTWLRVLTEHNNYRFYGLASGRYFLEVEGKTKDYRYQRIKTYVLIPQKRSKLIDWLRK